MKLLKSTVLVTGCKVDTECGGMYDWGPLGQTGGCPDDYVAPKKREITVQCQIPEFKKMDPSMFYYYHEDGYNVAGQELDDQTIFFPTLTTNNSSYGTTSGTPGMSISSGGLSDSDIGFSPCKANGKRGFFIEVSNTSGDQVYSRDYSTADFSNSSLFVDGDPYRPILKFNILEDNPKFTINFNYRSQTVLQYGGFGTIYTSPKNYFTTWESYYKGNAGASSFIILDDIQPPANFEHNPECN